MAEALDAPVVHATGCIGRLIERACVAMVMAAGLMFCAEMLMSAVSVLLRVLTGKGVPGDFELVQMLSAMGIAMCLPYCQFRKGHVFVDFFTLWAPAGLKRWLDALAALLMAACSFMLAWRIWEGMLDMYEFGEASMVIALPIWWGYVPVVPAFILLGLTALHTCYNEIHGERP